MGAGPMWGWVELRLEVRAFRDGLAGSHLLLQGDDLGHAVDHLLHKLHLREADTLLVRDVPLGPHSRRVLAGATAWLQVKLVAHLLQQGWVLVELRQLDHHRRAQARAKVGWASAQEAQLVGEHQLRAVGLCGGLQGRRQGREASEHALHVTAVLHGDDAAVILLVAPAQSSAGIVVEDTTALGPVACCTSVGEQVGHLGLLEQEAILLQEVLLVRGHLVQGVVLALELAREARERVAQHALHTVALLVRCAGRQREARHVTCSADARGHDVLVELGGEIITKGQVGGVQVGLVVLHLGVEAVPALDDGVHDVLEHCP
mmetsp:Transcript_104163/g.145078  ORF Transcript_104163/g.145078 Transcript_104163/m.145078 type:complete len:318 (-) Transcript_104163:422-1375(-)